MVAVKHMTMMDVLKANKELVAVTRDEIRWSIVEVQEGRVEFEDEYVELRDLMELSMDKMQELDRLTNIMSTKIKVLVLAIKKL
jgi:hypothetical protein